MNKEQVTVIGAGPGGLAAAMMLSARGFAVTVYEKQNYIGGRTSSFTKEGFTFDLGPTFFSMPHILEEVFEASGRRLQDYVNLHELEPMYSLSFNDTTVRVSRNSDEMKAEIARHFPGNEDHYDRFIKDTRKKMNILMPVLQTEHNKLTDYFAFRSLRAVPELELGKSLYDVLSSYFDDERLKLSFTFQSKYLGMSPWECPGAFSILSYMEHEWGIFHPEGGLNQLTKAMARVVEEHGGHIRLGTGVKKLKINDKRQVEGLILDTDEEVSSDHVVMNADFAKGMEMLIDDSLRRAHSNKKLEKKKYSCSTFMIYAGLDCQVDLDHHTILFSDDYKQNVEEITHAKVISDDPSIYVQNPVSTDKTLAPDGKAGLYILAPVPNNFSEIDWETSKEPFREQIWKLIEEKTGITDIQDHLIFEEILTPLDWENDKYVYKGATFNMAHNLGQMMYFRPHNEYQDFEGLWLVGGGTHPGSGLPTIFESGRITANLIANSYKTTKRVSL
ncbi:phytoene desaturase family protein [Salisediminibacterium beveridgei]|uniref:Phytoene dehydrogenase, CarC n=1 Tax=Salisediminibacterium beveridgei TaxID=632773 RepID=A0A1D7QUN1_9BACI|nr:phytoene desaturase family protein [Salisediminibacterium beveridgei]AOM82723.1 phytoene dehydrogenase, CarC [Salisediminibacterium beveridgei]